MKQQDAPTLDSGVAAFAFTQRRTIDSDGRNNTSTQSSMIRDTRASLAKNNPKTALVSGKWVARWMGWYSREE